MKKLIIPMCLLVLQGMSLPAQNNWPMVSGGACRTAFVSAETQLVPPLVLQSTIPVYTENILFYDGTLYLSNGGVAGTSAVNPVTGQVLWNFTVPNAAGSIGVVPAISGDRIFLGAQHGVGLCAVNRITGVQLWMKPLNNLFSRCPVTDGNGHVLICSDSLYCLDEATGQTIWTSTEVSYGTPSIKGQMVLISTRGSLTALNLASGTILWQAPRQINPLRIQVLVDSTSVYESGYGGSRAFSLADGSERWSHTLPNGCEVADFIEGNAVLADSVLVYVLWDDGTGKSKLVALHKSDGTLAWEYTSETTGISPPTAANGVVYITNYISNGMRGFSLATGALVFEDNTSQFTSQPVIANHRLYVATSSGTGIFKTDASSILETELSEPAISLFPNPFRDAIHIRQQEGGRMPEEIILYTATGLQVIRETNLKGNSNIRLNTARLPAGAYILSLKTGDQRSAHRMIRINDR